MRILVSNCNTTETMTDAIAEQARRVAAAGTEIVGLTPGWGPESCEGWYDSFLSSAAVLETIRDHPEPFDALVMAGFGEHGRQGAREMLSVPVVDITEAAIYVACLSGARYAIVTSLQSTVGLIEASVRDAGPWERCCGIFPTGVPVLEMERDPGRTTASFAEQSRAACRAGAEVIVLGCAGMSGLYDRLRTSLDVPVVDGVAAAVCLAESMHRLGLGSSGAYPASRLKSGLARGALG